MYMMVKTFKLTPCSWEGKIFKGESADRSIRKFPHTSMGAERSFMHAWTRKH